MTLSAIKVTSKNQIFLIIIHFSEFFTESFSLTCHEISWLSLTCGNPVWTILVFFLHSFTTLNNSNPLFPSYLLFLSSLGGDEAKHWGSECSWSVQFSIWSLSALLLLSSLNLSAPTLSAEMVICHYYQTHMNIWKNI